MGLRVAYAGTPEFARVALESVHTAGHAVTLVLTQPDRPAGRGLKLQPSTVKQFAQRAGLALSQPRSLRLDGKFAADAEAAKSALVAAEPDVMVVAAYGLILPAWILGLPQLGCINIHASLLPRWRGAAPIQRAIEAGDSHTGITVMQMDAGLDTGDMLLTRAEPIAAGDTAQTLHDRLAPLGARLVCEALEAAERGELRPVPQPPEGVAYAHKIDKAEAAIDWRQPAEEIERRVRAFDPFPGATFEFEAHPMKLWRAALSATASPAGVLPGTVLQAKSGRLAVACGRGALDLLELQRPGGKRVSAQSLLTSMAIAEGYRLGPI